MPRDRRTLGRLLAVGGSLVALASACGDEVRESAAAQRSSAIVHGTATSGSPEVVAILRRRTRCHEPFNETFCTGVLVGERVVLTAAHCASDDPPLDIEVYVGDQVNGGGGHFFAVADQLIHPAYDPDTFANDLALLELASSPGVAPVPLDPGAAPAVGDTVRVVGFGGEGSGTDGVKREGTSRVTAVEPVLLHTEPFPALACGGDSGAPVFVDGPSGSRLVGVVRSGDTECAKFANATLLDTYIDAFVRPYVTSPPTPSRRGASLTESFCSSPCAEDVDCPRGMLCLPERGLGMLCGYAELRSGSIGKVCSDDGECPSGLCVSSGPGDEGRTCGCFTACSDRPAIVPTAPAVTPQLEGGGVCGLARGAGPIRATTTALALALASALLAARSRRRRCAPPCSSAAGR